MAPSNSAEKMATWGDSIDIDTFNQILEMDDDDNREFSRSIVEEFLEQAVNTFGDMDEAIKKKDLKGVGSLGHFLKGSSATLGLNEIRDGCERIQNLGTEKDEEGGDDYPGDERALKRIGEILYTVKLDFRDVEAKLRAFYDM